MKTVNSTEPKTELKTETEETTPAPQADNPWRVRILPRVAFGMKPEGFVGMPPTAPQVRPGSGWV